MKRGSMSDGGGRKATTGFKHVFCVDFEFQIKNGDRPWPVCMVVTNATTKETKRYWRDDLLRLKQAPFDTGPDSLMVAYAAQAELGCMLELGWSLPVNVLCLYVVFRNLTNGRATSASLLSAQATFGLAHIHVSEKDMMRDLILRGNWSVAEQKAIVSYCESDVEALVALLAAMQDSIEWSSALLQGRYIAAVAQMERNGIPMDRPVIQAVQKRWHSIRHALVAEVDRNFGVYNGLTFKIDQFSRMLNRRGIPWRRLESKLIDLSDDAFKSRCVEHPEFIPLREIRQTLGQIRLDGLEIGSDGRARTSLRPFGSVTGRNQPSTTKFAFGPSKWMRSFIKPPGGNGLAYIDFVSQEMGLAAGLSQDPLLISAYAQDDVYLAFAKHAKLVPLDATKQSHSAIRERCKAVVLGQNYGMGPQAIALQAGITIAEARELIGLHKRTYQKFWSWSADVVEAAVLSGEMQTVFGWKRHVTSNDKTTSIMNFPMQANGAEMMRVAAIAATEEGIEVCAPIHDAFLICAPLDRLDGDVARMQEIMTSAGQLVAGIPIKTEAKVISFPDRYVEEKGVDMWNRVVRLIGAPNEQL